MRQVTRLAVLAVVAMVAAVPASAHAGGKNPPPKKECSKKHKKKCPTVKEGRMTGHGHNVTAEHGKVQWEFRNSVCGSDRFPDLKVEWGDGQRFVLTSYSVPLRCLDTPASEGMPRAGFDTIVGQGAGRLNGEAATASFRFTDNGEPGRDDLATITITDGDGNVVLSVTDLTAGRGGNHQAHRLTGRDAR
jgi:hypothetical protein